MPYIILNDRRKPWRYFTTQVVGISAPTSIDADAAFRYEGISAAAKMMSARSDLYAAGWRIEYVKV